MVQKQQNNNKIIDKMKRILLSAIALVVLVSCSKTEDVESAYDGELKITSSIATRAVDQNWESGDAIGVYMTETGSTTDYVGKANTQYSTTSTTESADFSVVSPDVMLYYPQSGDIDLMAYYPYKSDISVGAYPLDVTTQSPSKNIDLMIATASKVEKNKDAIPLTFDHKLSKVVITLTPADNSGLSVDDLKDMSVVLSGTITEATYDLNATTSPIDFGDDAAAADITLPTAVVGETSAVITSIVIPQSATPKFTFTLGGTDSYDVTASSMEFVGGNEHNYTIAITKTAAIITGSKINNWVDGADESGLTADDLN